MMVGPITLSAGSLELGGLIAEPASTPRALILALHGSGTTAQYFDAHTAPGLSLLELGAACGFTVIAVDRPGSGRSAGVPHLPGAAQAELMLDLIDWFAAERETGAGCSVLCHSSGARIGLRMGADQDRGRQLLGLESSGMGVHLAPDFAVAMESGEHYSRYAWGSADLYPPGAREALIAARTSPYDRSDLDGPWPDLARRLAEVIEIPVRLTLAEEEMFYANGPEALDSLRSLFPSSPIVEVVTEPSAGHNVSVGWAARAYHLKALAFVETCILHRRLS
jgi:pimeloyl-ACP methyl ester carboxylesterase